jgi:aminopeptidase N
MILYAIGLTISFFVLGIEIAFGLPYSIHKPKEELMVSPYNRFLFISLIVVYLTGCTAPTPAITPTPSSTPLPTLTITPAPSSTPLPAPDEGSPGIGDPYYPSLGNGGYDVQKYTIILDADPATNEVTGKTVIEAKAIQGLSTLNLDFQGFTVESVSVNGSTATFSREKAEMTVTPSEPLASGSTFTIEVGYHGIPTRVVSQAIPLAVGWFHSKDGTMNVLTEPDGASTWFPNNNHPRDKATYHFEVTVPTPWVVAATGSLIDTKQNGEKSTFIVEMDKPMATYLASVNIGHYELVTQSGPHGMTIRNYFPPDYPKSFRDEFNVLPAAIEFYESMFGPYPFKEYGVVIAGTGTAGCDGVGTADETQSLSIHCPTMTMATEDVIVHELAHQWFGDNVSLENWQDIWLKEGFATYAEWLWNSKNDPAALAAIAKEKEKSFFDSDLPVAKPTPDNLYTDESYTGGALVLQALHLKVGDENFIKIMKTYNERYGDGNASTDEFIALAQEVSGQDLGSFFEQWLFSNTMPALP